MARPVSAVNRLIRAAGPPEPGLRELGVRATIRDHIDQPNMPPEPSQARTTGLHSGRPDRPRTITSRPVAPRTGSSASTRPRMPVVKETPAGR
ncbi:hypothetical protein [Streptosporangium pseudovulgare]|uniref:Uncharacterized protein n=1 Tax=Streptosporangium pseudovulgare TaxID=35765 RepID=A0ABQ2QR96_9ACTN|nr:hypothetical protein [Streptosporangium pseudovulgare]GGP89660.1 hypothetical protein GCM10010140_19540 [Streptosporangium pseudovulgare]